MAVPVGGEEADEAVAVATIVEDVDTDDDTASMQKGGGTKSKSSKSKRSKSSSSPTKPTKGSGGGNGSKPKTPNKLQHPFGSYE